MLSACAVKEMDALDDELATPLNLVSYPVISFAGSAMKHVFVYLLILTFMMGALQAEPSVKERDKNGTKTKRDVKDVSGGNKIRRIARDGGLLDIFRFG
ncbi:hypothetical protein NPIL_430111 [Nephila pilipes]|uniref:Uncharacterized protein n=1 Tax=Nephila pilipes TaxID=299642 RepID=A0A8X6NUJ8_NEPPI|nr:hypothetical protein NPIL_430111 [Nephila pilipes]